MRKLYETYKTVILYLIFGVCTTLVNLACYHVLYDRLGAENVPSTAAAWVVSVCLLYTSPSPRD